MKAILQKCINNAHTWDNESWANMMHMVLPKRTPIKRYAELASITAKLRWNENKLTREVVKFDMRKNRSGARKNAVLAKPFRVKRKSASTTMCIAEILGRLRQAWEPGRVFAPTGWKEVALRQPAAA